MSPIDPRWALDQRVDPVQSPVEYQQLLVGLVGDRDPAQVQAAQPEQWAALLAQSGSALRTRPVPGEWSVLECAGHMLDAEIVSAARYRWILAQDEPPLVGYDQELWAKRLRHNQDDPEELLGLFGAIRRVNVELWARTPELERARVGIHAERGPESYDLSFRMTAGHGVFHLAQAERTLEAVRGP